jgi:hypothetical protein
MDMEQERLVSERERLDNGHGSRSSWSVSGRGWTMDMGAGAAGQ